MADETTEPAAPAPAEAAPEPAPVEPAEPAGYAEAVAAFEEELKTATGDRAIAIEASLRSLKNPGVTSDAEALEAESGAKTGA